MTDDDVEDDHLPRISRRILSILVGSKNRIQFSPWERALRIDRERLGRGKNALRRKGGKIHCIISFTNLQVFLYFDCHFELFLEFLQWKHQEWTLQCYRSILEGWFVL